MVLGALTLTNQGSFGVSAAALKTKFDTINIGGALSGGVLLVPIAGGMQVQLYSYTIAMA